MPALLYLLGLGLSLPLIGVALALLALHHVIETASFLRLLWEFLLAFTWGVPLLALAFLMLLVAGFVDRLRRPAAGVLLALNLAAIAIFFAIIGAPRDGNELLLLAPALLAGVVCGFVMLARHDHKAAMPRCWLAALMFGASGLAAPTALSRDLAVAVQVEATSIDPHFHSFGPNIAVALHIFDTLVRQGERHQLLPGLAERWETIDDLTWEFTLRRGVRFHDGRELTAEDVAASLRRAPKVPNSPGSFVFFTRAIVGMEIVDPHRIRLRTATPYPLLPRDLSVVAIVAHRFESATSSSFNTGVAAIGTGPFRFVEWRPGDRLILKRNDAYWETRVEWDGVVIRPIENDSARVAALLSGDVDVIEAVPPADVPTLRARPDTRVTQAASTRLIYLHMDSHSERAPFVTDERGRPLDRNPLRDARVRRAMSKAINRDAIVGRIMDGEAVVASQLLPDDMEGTNSALRPEPFDVEGARRLLAEAGYPAGFGITLHGPNNRFVNDERVLQTIGSMLNRVGIITRVEAMPFSVFAARNARHEFGFYLRSWLTDTGEPTAPLRALLATPDRERGMGITNFGRYGNPVFDAVLARSLTTLEAQAREKLVHEAVEIAMNDAALLPLYFQTALWGLKRGLAHTPRADGLTLAASIRSR